MSAVFSELIVSTRVLTNGKEAIKTDRQRTSLSVFPGKDREEACIMTKYIHLRNDDDDSEIYTTVTISTREVNLYT